MIKYIIDSDVKDKYPELGFYGTYITGVEITKPLQFVSALKKKIQADFRNKYNNENLARVPQVIAIRDLFKKMSVDPDMEPTAVENLTRLLYKGGLPNINSIVDSCNIASIGSLMPIGAFDADNIKGDLILRLSKEGESYLPIGMSELSLKGDLLVLADNEGIIARPMYKDSQRTMIELETKNIYIFTAMYPPIKYTDVRNALTLANQIVTTSSKGLANEIFAFEPIKKSEK